MSGVTGGTVSCGGFKAFTCIPITAGAASSVNYSSTFDRSRKITPGSADSACMWKLKTKSEGTFIATWAWFMPVTTFMNWSFKLQFQNSPRLNRFFNRAVCNSFLINFAKPELLLDNKYQQVADFLIFICHKIRRINRCLLK